MTHQNPLRIRNRAVCVRSLSVAILSVVVAVAASAQQDGVSQPSARHSAAPASAHTQGTAQTPPLSITPQGVKSQSISDAAVHHKKAASTAPDSGGSLFLPVVWYNAGAFATEFAAVADVNGDGIPDLVVAIQNCPDGVCGDGQVSVMLGNGDGTFRPAVLYSSGAQWANSVAVADLNGDGKPDIAVANYAGDSVGVLLGNGDGTFQSAVTYPTGQAAYVAIADVNGDGKPDLIAALSSGVGVLLGNGDGTFQPIVRYGRGSLYAVVTADVNRDGKIDLIASGLSSEGTVVIVWLGNGDGTFQPARTYNSGGSPGGFANSVAVADFDGDGIDDLVAANFPDSTVGVLLGNGDGTFQTAVLYGSGAPYAWSVATADLNGDGRIDIAVADFSTPIGVLLGNGDGTFQPPLTFAVGAADAGSLAIADVNGDGRPDLIVTNGSNLVGVLLNSGAVQNVTTTNLSSSLNPSVYGQTVAFTVMVTSSSGTPTGTVKILDGATVVATGILANGSALISVPALPAGANSITAAFQGSASFAPSRSAPLTQTVTAATTTTTLASSLNPAGTNQSVTFTATVTSQHGAAATGSVVFSSGSQTLSTASLSGNTASLTTSFSTIGTDSISAKYNGDANNTGSTSSALNQRVIASTTTTLVSSLNPSFAGQSVTFTATVSSTSGLPPNGETITFKNGSSILGTASLSGGTATLTTSSLTAGIYTVTASYPGDANFAASTSPALRQVVNSTTKSATATTLVSSLNPSIYGQSVTWTAAVTTAGSVPPTGKVNFRWSIYIIGSATLNSSGVATLTKTNLNADTYPLTAVYVGDTSNLGSTSSVVSQVVTPATSSATLTSSPNPSSSGQTVTFTATIKSPTAKPSGPVAFAVGKTVLGTVQLSGGKATFTTTTLPVGATKVTATYSGDSSIGASSASVTQTVQ